MTESMSDDSTHEVYLSNTERVLVDDGPATGNSATKTAELVGRDIWRTANGTLVLPAELDDAYVDYAASLGWQPRIIVPEGVDLSSIDITAGLSDNRIQQAVAGSNVTSYVADRRLERFVRGHGGTYDWGDPSRRPTVTNGMTGLAGNTVHEIVNDKANIRGLTDGILQVPAGVAIKGLSAIAEAVRHRLADDRQEDGGVFVRNTRSGGGFGNARFTAEDADLDDKAIIAKLTSANPEVWRHEAALVEDYDPPHHSPAITMYVGGQKPGMAYHSLQISRKGDFVGMVSPTPEHILETEHARHIADELCSRLGGLGYRGYAGIDLGVWPDVQRMVGYEINGRRTGSMHPIAVGEGLLGPWESWQQEGHTVKAIDRLYLKHEASFSQLHHVLDTAGLLATAEDPYGAVITIPPATNVNGSRRSIAGISVLANGHHRARQLAWQVLELVGDNDKNWYDDPEV